MPRPVGGEKPQRFQHHESPDAVVDAAAHQPAVGKFEDTSRQHAGIADPHPRLRLAPVSGSDIDPEILDFRYLLPLFPFHEVNRAFAYYADHRPCAAQQNHPLSDEDLMVPPADGVEAEVALRIDVRHHHADLIDVAGKHQAGRGVRVDGGKGVAADIGMHRVGELARLGPPYPGGCRLEGRGTRRVQQRFQERQ